MPLTGSPPMTSPGYPWAAMTTQTAEPDAQVGGGTSARRPSAAASNRSLSGDSIKRRTAWISGSPNRALNSTTRNPFPVSARPQYRTPEKGVPRRAISAIVGRATCVMISSTRSTGAQSNGV